MNNVLNEQSLSCNLIERAKAMKIKLKERAASVENDRIVSDVTIAEFHEAGFFKIIQPKEYGGYELPPVVLTEVISQISSACGSSGWVLAVLALHQWEARFLSHQGQEEIWGDNPLNLMSSSYVPSGKVLPVDGGYIISGDWAYSSGCDHAQWAIVGGIRPPVDQGSEPVFCGFFVPRSDYEIIDDWHTFGLSGTGSRTLRLKEVFVPSHRHHPIFGASKPAPGNAGALYKIPFGVLFIEMLAATCRGIAQGALNEFIERNKNRTAALDNAKYSESPDVHLCISETHYAVSSAKALGDKNISDALSIVNRGEDIPIFEQARMLFESGRGVQACNEAIGKLYAQSGAHTIFEGDSLQRLVRDLQAGSTHVAFKQQLYGRNFGSMYMGQPNKVGFI